MQQQYFYELADFAQGKLQANEIFTAYLAGEESDFCRLNGGKVRQAGSVHQDQLLLRLINGQRNAEGTVGLSGIKDEDRRRAADLLGILRAQIAELPDDPYLLYATDVCSSERRQPNQLQDAREVIQRIAARVQGQDMVGIYASGAVHRGFANSFGQRNWFETYSFNLDWSFYLRADKAVKTGYAGFAWNDDDFGRKVESAREQLAVLDKEPRTIKPGKYRVYLAPQALNEVADMLTWGGFSLKAHKTKQTPLIKMVEAGARLNPGVTLLENTAAGLSPDFNSSGFTKPGRVTLVEEGSYKDCLVSPRSAKEYAAKTNGASDQETPQSLELGAGTLPAADIARLVGDGVYLNNLWYLNFSDKPACRVTGMTRFASFWVEKGRITQPLNVMRFDESVLRMLGDKLVGLTAEREMILSADTYGQRSTNSVTLPGAVVEDFSFTL